MAAGAIAVRCPGIMMAGPVSDQFHVGDVVEWRPLGSTSSRRGVVSRIKRGRVYVKSSLVNNRGRRVSRTVECFFEPGELDRLWLARS